MSLKSADRDGARRRHQAPLAPFSVNIDVEQRLASDDLGSLIPKVRPRLSTDVTPTHRRFFEAFVADLSVQLLAQAD
jgi:hypothetical protein